MERLKLVEPAAGLWRMAGTAIEKALKELPRLARGAGRDCTGCSMYGMIVKVGSVIPTQVRID